MKLNISLKWEYLIITCTLMHAYVGNHIALYVDAFLGASAPVDKCSRSGSLSPTTPGVRPELSRPYPLARPGIGLLRSSPLVQKGYLGDRCRILSLMRSNGFLAHQAGVSVHQTPASQHRDGVNNHMDGQIRFETNHNFVSDSYPYRLR